MTINLLFWVQFVVCRYIQLINCPNGLLQRSLSKFGISGSKILNFIFLLILPRRTRWDILCLPVVSIVFDLLNLSCRGNHWLSFPPISPNFSPAPGIRNVLPIKAFSVGLLYEALRLINRVLPGLPSVSSHHCLRCSKNDLGPTEEPVRIIELLWMGQIPPEIRGLG